MQHRHPGGDDADDGDPRRELVAALPGLLDRVVMRPVNVKMMARQLAFPCK